MCLRNPEQFRRPHRHRRKRPLPRNPLLYRSPRRRPELLRFLQPKRRKRKRNPRILQYPRIPRRQIRMPKIRQRRIQRVLRRVHIRILRQRHRQNQLHRRPAVPNPGLGQHIRNLILMPVPQNPRPDLKLLRQPEDALNLLIRAGLKNQWRFTPHHTPKRLQRLIRFRSLHRSRILQVGFPCPLVPVCIVECLPQKCDHTNRRCWVRKSKVPACCQCGRLRNIRPDHLRRYWPVFESRNRCLSPKNTHVRSR